MASLNVRVDDEMRDEFDSLAQARGVSGSELLRVLVAQALGRDEDTPSKSSAPKSLTVLQRRQLAQQHKILSLIDTDEYGAAEYHQKMVEVLESGFTSEYYKLFQGIEAELTARESALVRDILDMFDLTERTVESLSSVDLSSLGETDLLKFRGFDLNDRLEGRLHSYAQFLINDRKWERLADRFAASHEGGNSHFPVLATYQRMLSVAKPFKDKMMRTHGGPNNYNFSVDELIQIRDAWAYPRN